MISSFNSIILAAGLGVRMKIDVPKVLAPLAGKRLIDFPLRAIQNTLENRKIDNPIGVVLGNRRDKVIEYLQKNHSEQKFEFAEQKQINGTAGAVKAYFADCPTAEKREYTLIICGDTPLISCHELEQLISHCESNPKLMGVAATIHLADPTGYGRIIQGKPGFNIIEEKDTTAKIAQINEVNSALYFVKTDFLLSQLESITNNNAAAEFYLTDIFQRNLPVTPLNFKSAHTFMGVNSLVELQVARKLLNEKKVEELSRTGVFFIDGSSVYLDDNVKIAPNTTIYPNVHLYGQVEIGSGTVIEPGTIIKSSKIDTNVLVKANSYIEDSSVKSGAKIGPFANLRPGSLIGKEARIGNFVEIKKSSLGTKAKISHLSYIGDAQIGENTNIGCGFITCNYDGINKHKTKIGKNSFIGSDTQVIAPIEIGDNCFIGSGSTVNKNVPDGAFAIARARLDIKRNMAKRFLPTKDRPTL